MNLSQRRQSSWPAGRAAVINPVCEEYEDELKAGHAPHLRDYLSKVDESDRSDLEIELRELDRYYRKDSRNSNSPCPSVGRNLFFGIFALQVDFIKRDQLLAAMNAWVREKSKPLGEILCNQGVLTSENRDWLEAGVDRHIALHGNDARKSLASVNTVGYVRKDLEQIADPDLQENLPHLAIAQSSQRFRVLKQHAKGGLGEVFLAHDEEVHREVALKEIQERYADNSQFRARFLLEAEITGGLEHPGIVPVYGLGHYADGRPFYAMRFIKGDSLKDAIKRFHSPDAKESANSAERYLELRQLLGRFIDVCQAMQYAHDRGVLHRDLKPGNIMLGKYGETLIVDWGLAKAEDKDAPGDAPTLDTEPPLRPPSASSVDISIAGKPYGTPQYMSPEQAAGRLDLLSSASDVYSLGATLYSILTGQPSVDGENPTEVLAKVKRGEIPRPRQVNPHISPALEAVCLKAMALDPAKRYASPRLLAEEIERWLADEPVHAWSEPMVVRAKRWVRRHQTFATSMAASIFILTIAGIVGGFWYHAEKTHQESERQRRRAEAGFAIKSALVEAEKPRKELHDILKQPGGVFQLLDRPERWRAYIDSSRASLKAAQDRFRSTEEGVEPELAECAARVDTSLRRDEADRLLAIKLDKIRSDRYAIVDGKFDLRSAATNYPDAFAEADAGLSVDSPERVAARLAQSAIHEQLVAALDDWALVSFTGNNTNIVARLLEISRFAASDPAWGDQIRQIGVWEKKKVVENLVRDARDAKLSLPMLILVGELLPHGSERVLWLRQAQEKYPSDFMLNFRLGSELAGMHAELTNADAEAIGFLRAAIALRPRHVGAHNNLGLALRYQKKLPEAIAAFQKAVEIDPKFATTYINLGTALYDQRKLPEAIAAFQMAIEINPKSSTAYNNLGIIFRKEKNKLPEAIAAYQKAIEINPKYVAAYINLGIALRNEKKLPEAIVVFQKVIELDPKNSAAYNNIGYAQRDQKNLPEAVAAFQKAIGIDPKYSKAYNSLGFTLRYQKKHPEAIAAFQKAVEIDPEFAAAYNNLGLSLHDQEKLPEAIAAYQKAIEIDPKYAEAHNNFGCALGYQKKLSEAITAFQKAIAIDPMYAAAYKNLGVARRHQEEAVDTINLATQATKNRHYTLATRFYCDAFAKDASLADNLDSGHRYVASCYAVLAAAGQGDDAAKLTAEQAAQLRQDALKWLQADLAVWTKRINDGTDADRKAATKKLRLWQRDSDLTWVRAGIDDLTVAERLAWHQLWSNVAALLKKVEP